MDPLDIAEEDTEIYSNWRFRYFIWKHVSNKIQDYHDNNSCVNCSSYSCHILILLL
jgi:hypothetical protein